MASTFFGLTIASSGLNTSQAQINTTANNISNVNTNGYSKQVVNTMASSALRCYQSYGTTGTGVEATSVTQCRDLYYDEKYWNNQSSLGLYEKKLYYMEQIEDYFSETNSTNGFTTLYTKMFNAMSTLQTSAGDDTVRKEFISNAKELTEYFNQLSTKLKELQSSVNDEVKTTVDQINSIAEKIAVLNKQINVIEQGGGTANELRDQRALLVDELSELVDVETKEIDIVNTNDPDMDTGATYYTVKINGQVLVDNYEYDTLSCVARAKDEKYNQCDVDGLYDIVWSENGDTFNATPSSDGGSLKALFEIRDGNNAENMKGSVTTVDSKSLTITGLSITDINELNMPSTGSIWVNSEQFSYDSFDFETDTNGNITSVTFNLKETLSGSKQAELFNKKLTVGSSVDFMGIAYYQNQMNVFLRNFSEAFNDLEKTGRTLDNEKMSAFFIAQDTLDSSVEHAFDAEKLSNKLSSTSDSYYLLTAGNISINSKSDKDSSYFATTVYDVDEVGQDAADLLTSLQKLQSETTLFRGGGGDAFLQCIYADVTVDTQECKTFTTNYTNIQASITQQRLSVAGVDEDEEALDLIKFQNAYNLASKCVSVLSEIYDRLILETGV